nr:hypothetical protein [Tanacetum cinerariifolium]
MICSFGWSLCTLVVGIGLKTIEESKLFVSGVGLYNVLILYMLILSSFGVDAAKDFKSIKGSLRQSLSLDVNANDIQGDVDEISRNDDVCQGNEIRIDSSIQAVNAASPSINTANTIIDAGSLNMNNTDSNRTNMPALEATGIFNGAIVDKDLDFKDGYYDLDGDVLYLESLHSDDTTPNCSTLILIDIAAEANLG